MNYLSVENISKRFGDKLLFENLSFGIAKGQKIGLIAANGIGKSTLLKILSGSESHDEGNVIFRNDIRIAHLTQDHGLNPNQTVLDSVFESDIPIMNAVRRYEAMLLEDADQDAFQRACDEMDALSAWDFDARAKQMLDILGLKNVQQQVKTLSGGQKRRVAIAKTLLQEPDFLILDEPTNHLDLDMIEWLEQYLLQSSMTMLMVTHDRYYLEYVCDEILELADQQMYRYKGNFGYYLEKKAEREEQETASVDKAKNLMRKELVWMRQSPKARTTKSKYRQDKFGELKDSAQGKREQKTLNVDINMERLGGKIIEMHKASKAYDDINLLNPFDYAFKRNERVGIVGKNGSGKSTFLKLLTGEILPDKGKVVIGETVVFGHYTQEGIQFKDNQRVIEAVRDIAEVIPLKGGKKITAAELLERFMFSRKRHFEHISKLSGGEKKRLFLLTVLMKNPNFLILDEPTNDLDIFTLSALEDYLESFGGCLVVVSHDRYFMDKLVDHLFWLKGDGEIKDVAGNYNYYRKLVKKYEQSENAAKASADKAQSDKEVIKSKEKTKLTFKEKFEFEQLEKDIESLENRKAELEELLTQQLDDHEKVMALSEELGKVIEELNSKGDRWLELSELV